MKTKLRITLFALAVAAVVYAGEHLTNQRADWPPPVCPPQCSDGGN